MWTSRKRKNNGGWCFLTYILILLLNQYVSRSRARRLDKLRVSIICLIMKKILRNNIIYNNPLGYSMIRSTFKSLFGMFFGISMWVIDFLYFIYFKLFVGISLLDTNSSHGSQSNKDIGNRFKSSRLARGGL